MQITRNGKKYVVAEGHEWFWKIFEDGSWEPTTFNIFDKFLDKEKNFIDIGAWIGPTTLYAADKAKQVFSFEPDPVAYRSLVQNIDLNKIDNVVPYPVAVSNSWKGIPFGVKTAAGDSMSSELWATGDDVKVAAVSLEALIVDIQPNFIKIDIEGGEKMLLEGITSALRHLRPTIHLSLHTPWFKDDLIGFQSSIMKALAPYPFFYDENLNLIEMKNAFDPNAFNSIVATFTKLV